MKRSDIKKLHFISPIENLASILEYGILCHNRAKELPHQSVAMNEIEETRRDKRIPGAGVLHDYENLYFDAHNPMLSRLRSLNDRLGTPEILTDASGTVAWEAWYEPFGEAHIHPSPSVVNNIRLPGQYYDSETGFHYNHFRYYDPRVGRYVTPDPIGQSGGINLFTYALCNPVNATDPLGLFGLGGAIGGAFTFFGYRGAIDFELRIIKDLDKSLFSGWSLGLTYTYSWTNYWEDHQCEEDKPFAWGIEGDVGTRVMLTNANNIGQILGNSVPLVGAAGGLGPYGGSVEMSVMTEDNHRTPIKNGGDPVWELAAAAYPMPGWALGAEAHLKTRNVTRGLYTIGQR